MTDEHTHSPFSWDDTSHALTGVVRWRTDMAMHALSLNHDRFTIDSDGDVVPTPGRFDFRKVSNTASEWLFRYYSRLSKQEGVAYIPDLDNITLQPGVMKEEGTAILLISAPLHVVTDPQWVCHVMEMLAYRTYQRQVTLSESLFSASQRVKRLVDAMGGLPTGLPSRRPDGPTLKH